MALSSITSYPSTVGVIGRSSQLCPGVSGSGWLEYSTERWVPLSLARVTGLGHLSAALSLSLSARGARYMGTGTGTNGVAIAPHTCGDTRSPEEVCEDCSS